ncbi:MAG: hypothetical protein LBP58_01400 [Azoarcus sp.]|jgi:hypothetical protein|nr:hypothetical protein [Azoarcus sp.]
MASSYQWLPAALIPAATALRDRVDLGGSNAKFEIYSESNTLLATLPLANPSSSIDGNGKLIFTPGGLETNAPASGVAHHARLFSGDGTLLLDISVVAGAEAVPGYLVISTANIIQGGQISLILVSVG